MSMVKIVLELLNMEVRELITAENITTINSPRNPKKYTQNAYETSVTEHLRHLSDTLWFSFATVPHK